MSTFIQKTLGGISRSFYIRELLLGSPIYILVMYFFYQESTRHSLLFLVVLFAFITIKHLAYPYARFVYHSVTDYILGRDVYFVNIFILLFLRLIMMLFCWMSSIILALIGLVYLYFKNRNL